MDILLYLISYAMGLFLIYSGINLFYANKKRNEYVVFVIFALLFITSSIIYLVFNNTLYNILTNILFLNIITIYYNIHTLNMKNIISAVGVACACYVIVTLMEMFIVGIGREYTIKIDQSMDLREISQPQLFYIIQFILYSILVLILRFFIDIKHTERLSIKYKIPTLLIPGISYYIAISLSFSGKLNSSTMAVIIVLMFLLNLIFFWQYNVIGKFYKENADKVIIQKENAAYLKQMEFAKGHQIKTAKIKHDINMHLTTVKELIKDGEIAKAEEYIQDIVYQTEEIKVLSKSGNIIVDTVLNDILTQCEEKDISVEYCENIPEEFRVISDIDLNSVLYNVLNNAVTATSNLPDSERKISIRIEYDKKILIFNVKNSYDGILNMDNNANILSRKKDKTIHGYGIKNISNIVQKYDGNIKIHYNTTTFIIAALLYDSPK